MNIGELLSDISNIAKENELSKPFIIGGVPRDRIIGSRGKKSEIQDVDLTTGDKDSPILARAVAEKYPNSNYRTYDDGHASLDIGGLHVDFSSNFIAPGVQEQLEKMGVKDITPMKLELYSRDFHINLLLEDLDFSTIYDVTGEAIDDINAGIIRCPIDPNITIGVDPRRIIRAIRFAIKFGFTIDDELKTAMLNHKDKVKALPQKHIAGKVNDILALDSDKAIDMLIEYKLLPIVPMTKRLSDMLIQKRQLVRAL